ncbi:MAG: ABC transporter substrate-binding protein [Acidiferrobacter sp.]
MGWQERWGRVGFFACILSLCVGVASAHATNVQPAVAVIARFQQTLLHVMKKAPQLGFTGRYRILVPAVGQSHDLKFIAEITVGPYWQRLSAASRQAFVKTFTQLTVATYAAQFDGYSGETFQETAAHVIGRGDVLVETTLTSHGHKEATLDYLLAPVGAQWKIINIVANGVSDLALKRAQYTAIIQKKGFPALLAMLRAKVAQLGKAPKAHLP